MADIDTCINTCSEALTGDCAVGADVSYRKDGAQQYGAQPFLSLLLDVYNPHKQAGGAMQLSAAEVAFAELGVSWSLQLFE